ncbi:MAG: hypothetical protein AAF092_04960 [Pseudomonadota bacterium]
MSRRSRKAPDPDEVLAELGASAPRRIFACVMSAMLGAMLFALAVLAKAEFVMSIGLALLAFFVLWRGWVQWSVTEARLILTRRELKSSDGVVLTAVDDIAKVERGILAFKPSQGFLLRLKAPAESLRAPGLYWRFGRSLGVGGVTSAGAGKFMAEMIQALIAERDG